MTVFLQEIAEIVHAKAGKAARAEERVVDHLPFGSGESNGFKVRFEVVNTGNCHGVNLAYHSASRCQTAIILP